MDFGTWQTLIGSVTGVGLGTSAYLSPWLWRQNRMGLIRRRIARSRILALTYDDGPSGVVTPQLLDLLQHRGAHATFFLLGRNARQYPHMADRIAREGHDVGCHSSQHINAWKAPPWSALADIQAGYSQLSPWIPQNGMFRPPHGKMTFPTYWAIRRRGAPVWWWTIDSGDTHRNLPAAAEVVDNVRRNNGGIVLMHDLDRDEERNDFVLKVTNALLDIATVEGLKVATLRELPI